jgi:dsDNA-specific endonuclease/ATPase MutS2
MQFKVGDSVKFLNATGSGKVLRILGGDKIEVENEHGFEEVFPVSELVTSNSASDYKTDNLNFDKEISNKANADNLSKQDLGLKRKFKHLDDYGQKDRDLIDLHIENLIDSHRGMGNAEILNIQMVRFRRFLNASINKQHRKIVVIHGVGEGVLRNEIRKELDYYHQNLEYYDASYQEFGMGATEIILR